MNEAKLLRWYKQHVRPCLEKNAPDRLPLLDSDCNRLEDLLTRPDDVNVCFLGNSGVGKSTLLNALAAGAGQVLPAGGIGPLTAQATEVRYAEVPTFTVRYHPKSHLWRVAFALETGLRAKTSSKAPPADRTAGSEDEELTESIDSETRKDIVASVSAKPTDGDGPPESSLDAYAKQARHIICGDQFAQRSIEYLADALRLACGRPIAWGQEVSPEDKQRIDRIQEVLKLGTAKQVYTRKRSEDPARFDQELMIHAAGFLSPLIERIEVGWPSELLRSGVVLVDLPGVGIAQDSYRDVTKRYIREKARAVVLVVDRAGPTESSIDLLRTSGYWDRLVGSADDPSSDPCAMLIAVTRVDDVTESEWRSWTEASGKPKPRKRDVFAKLVEEFKPRMRAQISEQLSKIGDSSNEALRTAREQARNGILSGLEIHPVSAPELRKILADDEDDRPFLQDPEQTGVPGLQTSLSALATTEKANRRAHIAEVSDRLARAALSELNLVNEFWRQESRAAEEARKLEEALEAVVQPKRQEYGRRAGAFREYLKATVQARIEALVLEAREAAEEEVNGYLKRLRNAHWATLRAAVRRGGSFHGSLHVNLPDDISGYFQEPMVAVWGQKLLVDVRNRTRELASDIEQMVLEICEWAEQNAGASVNQKLLDAQKERVKALSAQMRAVGKEAVDELRETVKRELTAVIRKPIKAACERFVDEGDDIGPGVKGRILELFQKLAKQATTAAKKPAIDILTANFDAVRKEIQSEFRKGGDPIEATAAAIVERHEDRIKRSDAQKRGPILADLERVLRVYPGGAPEHEVSS